MLGWLLNETKTQLNIIICLNFPNNPSKKVPALKPNTT